jgi:hypothetical protein
MGGREKRETVGKEGSSSARGKKPDPLCEPDRDKNHSYRVGELA